MINNDCAVKYYGFWMVYNKNRVKKDIKKLVKNFNKYRRNKHVFNITFIWKPPLYDYLEQKGTIGFKWCVYDQH